MLMKLYPSYKSSGFRLSCSPMAEERMKPNELPISVESLESS